jgi:hypothetical protein
VTRTIRLFLLIQGAAFITAALTHFGVLIQGYEHHKAGTAEGMIGSVLLVGLGLTWIRPASSRGIGVSVQAFALFGTLVGIFTIVIGVGPRTLPDITYHLVIVTVLVFGLVTAVRAPKPVGKPGKQQEDPYRVETASTRRQR